METPFPFRLLTPSGAVFDAPVLSVVAPGAAGVLGVLAHHAPLLSAVRPGLVKAQQADGAVWFLIGDSFLRTDGEQCVLLADFAERMPSAAAGLERIRQLGWDERDLRVLTAPEP